MPMRKLSGLISLWMKFFVCTYSILLIIWRLKKGHSYILNKAIYCPLNSLHDILKCVYISMNAVPSIQFVWQLILSRDVGVTLDSWVQTEHKYGQFSHPYTLSQMTLWCVMAGKTQVWLTSIEISPSQWCSMCDTRFNTTLVIFIIPVCFFLLWQVTISTTQKPIHQTCLSLDWGRELE